MQLHMAQLMPLPLTVSCKSRLVLPFWYRLTRVVPEKGRKRARVCIYHLFGPVKKLLCGQKFAADVEVQWAVHQWLAQQLTSFSAGWLGSREPGSALEP